MINCDEIERKQFFFVDFLKIFFCMCVVAIHTQVFSDIAEPLKDLVYGILRMAVPYFFCISGFLFAKTYLNGGGADGSRLIKKYFKRLLKPFIVFSAIWMIQTAIPLLQDGTSLVEVIVYIFHQAIVYPLNALWYVQASLVGIIICYPFMKKNKLVLGMVIGMLLYAFALLSNNYYFVVYGTPAQTIIDLYLRYFFSARNGIFVGFFFMICGAWCATVNIKFEKKLIKWLIVILALILFAMEILLLHNKLTTDDASLFISFIVLIPVLVLCSTSHAIEVGTNEKLCNVAKKLRNLSTGIYFVHKPLIILFLGLITNKFVLFVVVTVISVSICLLSYVSKNKFINSLLK